MTEQIYSKLVKRTPEAEAELPREVRANLPRNSLRLVTANALQSSGDQTVNASTVLPWLLHALGAPPALTGLLVPRRPSSPRGSCGPGTASGSSSPARGFRPARWR